MPKWGYTENRAVGGFFVVVFSVPGGASYDVTYFRDVPVQVNSYSTGDPFGDATAELSFPQITGFDELGGGVLPWLNDNASVDIWWLNAHPGDDEIIDSLTQDRDLDYNPAGTGGWLRANGTKVWEGIVASMAVESGEREGLTIQCQGALYQLDRYVQKPFFPPRPYTNEALLKECFDPLRRQHLRTRPLQVVFPAGWTKVAKSTAESVFDPVGARPGEKVTGYSTRQTGSFERVLTGFCQDLIAVMYVDEESGVAAGSKWTILKGPNRQPVLKLRDKYASPTWTISYGQPGVTCRLSREIVSAVNILYGEGTSVDQTQWRNISVTPTGERTEYIPLAYDPEIWPYTSSTNPGLNRERIANETFVKYGSGFGLEQAFSSAAQMLSQDRDPGWSGTITLSMDLPFSNRWLMKAGSSIRLRNFAGQGPDGIVLHIAEVVCQPDRGTVELKVDTKYRDLLTLEEVTARTRDPLTPTRALQVNRRSITIEDRLAPWDYDAGSGFVPKGSTGFFANIAGNDFFPWKKQAKRYRPRSYPQFYVRCNADHPDPNKRWALTTSGTAVPVIMAQQGTIRLTQVAAYTYDGDPALCRFHMSVYYNPVGVTSMPQENGVHSPFIEGAFYDTDENGMPWPQGSYKGTERSIKIGWGNADQPAGYWPGRFTDGYPETGLMVDESTWDFNTSTNPDFKQQPSPGETQRVNAYTMYVMFYAEYTEPVYFIARFFRQEPGS